MNNIPGYFTYTDFQSITYEEFYDILWEDFVSPQVISTAWLDENADFVDNITFDAFRNFEMDPSMSIRILARTVESIIFNMFKFKPGQENIIEIEDNYKDF